MLELLTVIIKQFAHTGRNLNKNFWPVGDLGGLIGINDTWLRFRDARNIDPKTN